MKIVERDVPPRSVWALEQAGVHPLLARLYAARGVRARTNWTTAWPGCCRPTRLRGTREAAELLADAIAADSAGSASWPTTTATAPRPAPSRCAGCGCWARGT